MSAVPAPASERRSRFGQTGWRRRQLVIAFAWILMILLFVVVSLFEPGFRSNTNIRSIVDQSMILGIVGLGQTLVIICRGIDLSVPAMMGVSGVLLARHGTTTGDVVGALVLIVPIAIALGLVNGLSVALLRAPAIVVTLATNTLLLGALLVTTNGATSQTGGEPAKLFRTLSTGHIGPISVSGLVWIGIAIVAVALLAGTRFGRHVYAIGNNPVAARMSGVPVIRTVVSVYVVSSLCAALGGLLLAGYLNQTFPDMGSDYLFTSIAVVLIGGASILGGTGNYLGTIAGALTLSILGGVLAILNLGPAYMRILYGVLIFVTVGLGTLLARRGGRST
ncbi:MAG: inner-rane translocator [Conexibacter sp.]|jgi:ribose transport system permease protein|nr:inner-rane translocator [Conexibacter sp.]